MNQQEMIDAIHEANGNLKKTDIMSVLKLQGDVAQATLSQGNEVTLHGIVPRDRLVLQVQHLQF